MSSEYKPKDMLEESISQGVDRIYQDSNPAQSAENFIAFGSQLRSYFSERIAVKREELFGALTQKKENQLSVILEDKGLLADVEDTSIATFEAMLSQSKNTVKTCRTRYQSTLSQSRTAKAVMLQAQSDLTRKSIEIAQQFNLSTTHESEILTHFSQEIEVINTQLHKLEKDLHNKMIDETRRAAHAFSHLVIRDALTKYDAREDRKSLAGAGSSSSVLSSQLPEKSVKALSSVHKIIQSVNAEISRLETLQTSAAYRSAKDVVEKNQSKSFVRDSQRLNFLEAQLKELNSPVRKITRAVSSFLSTRQLKIGAGIQSDEGKSDITLECESIRNRLKDNAEYTVYRSKLEYIQACDGECIVAPQVIAELEHWLVYFKANQSVTVKSPVDCLVVSESKDAADSTLGVLAKRLSVELKSKILSESRYPYLMQSKFVAEDLNSLVSQHNHSVEYSELSVSSQTVIKSPRGKNKDIISGGSVSQSGLTPTAITKKSWILKRLEQKKLGISEVPRHAKKLDFPQKVNSLLTKRVADLESKKAVLVHSKEQIQQLSYKAKEAHQVFHELQDKLNQTQTKIHDTNRYQTRLDSAMSEYRDVEKQYQSHIQRLENHILAEINRGLRLVSSLPGLTLMNPIYLNSLESLDEVSNSFSKAEFNILLRGVCTVDESKTDVEGYQSEVSDISEVSLTPTEIRRGNQESARAVVNTQFLQSYPILSNHPEYIQYWSRYFNVQNITSGTSFKSSGQLIKSIIFDDVMDHHLFTENSQSQATSNFSSRLSHHNIDANTFLEGSFLKCFEVSGDDPQTLGRLVLANMQLIGMDDTITDKQKAKRAYVFFHHVIHTLGSSDVYIGLSAKKVVYQLVMNQILNVQDNSDNLNYLRQSGHSTYRAAVINAEDGFELKVCRKTVSDMMRSFTDSCIGFVANQVGAYENNKLSMTLKGNANKAIFDIARSGRRNGWFRFWSAIGRFLGLKIDSQLLMSKLQKSKSCHSRPYANLVYMRMLQEKRSDEMQKVRDVAYPERLAK